MSEAKRGRLRSVAIRPMYDEKGKIAGHTVSADHEAVPEKGKEGWGGYVPAIETPHETEAGAMEKVSQHLADNSEKQGMASKGRSMKDAIKAG